MENVLDTTVLLMPSACQIIVLQEPAGSLLVVVIVVIQTSAAEISIVTFSTKLAIQLLKVVSIVVKYIPTGVPYHALLVILV